jgi:hypothetical protein
MVAMVGERFSNLMLLVNFYFVFGCSRFAFSRKITANQKIVAVYGRSLSAASQYGPHKYASWIINATFI